jgi:hypothetical protein
MENLTIIKFQEIESIQSGKRTLVYTLDKLPEKFGASKQGYKNTLVCEITHCTTVRLLEDLEKEESCAALDVSKEQFLERWTQLYLNLEPNPLVYCQKFKWTGVQFEREFLDFVEEQDHLFFKAIEEAIELKL